MTDELKGCPIHKIHGHPDCNKCMKALMEMVTKFNGVLFSEDGENVWLK